MRRYLMLTTIIICFGMCSYAQDNINMIEILNIEQDVISLENRITDLTKKKSEISDIQGLRQFHIFWLSIDEDSLKKEDFLDYSFLYQLRFSYYSVFRGKRTPPHRSLLYRLSPYLYYHKPKPLFRKKRKYIATTTLITDSLGNLVSRGDARLVYGRTSFDSNDVKLAKMFFDKEIDFAFYLGGTLLGRYIGIKGNNLFAFEVTKEGLKIYSWRELIECCFDEWVYPRAGGKQYEVNPKVGQKLLGGTSHNYALSGILSSIDNK